MDNSKTNYLFIGLLVVVTSCCSFFFLGVYGYFVMAYVCLYKFSVPIGLYGFQHYMSILGSLILIPLVIVPAMGGTYVSSYNFYNIYLFCKKSKEFCGLLGLIGFSGF